MLGGVIVFGLWHDGYRLLLAPIMIEHFGWESVFYAFGLLGIIWYEPEPIPLSTVCYFAHADPGFIQAIDLSSTSIDRRLVRTLLFRKPVYLLLTLGLNLGTGLWCLKVQWGLLW